MHGYVKYNGASTHLTGKAASSVSTISCHRPNSFFLMTHLSDSPKTWQINKTGGKEEIACLLWAERKESSRMWGLISNYFTCAICLELQLVSYSSQRKTERLIRQVAGWGTGDRGIGREPNSIRKQSAKASTRVQSLPETTIEQLSLCLFRYVFERKKRRGWGGQHWSFQTCLIICSGDVWYATLVATQTQTTQATAYYVLVPGGDKLCSCTDVPWFLCRRSSFGSSFKGQHGYHR